MGKEATQYNELLNPFRVYRYSDIQGEILTKELVMRTLPDYLPKGTGERARLIPIVADTSKEQRAASTLLACIEMVEEFGRGILDSVKAPIRKTSKIETYTEVCFSGAGEAAKLRPDGLITVRTGSKVWFALVEAKIGNAILDERQINQYVELARAVKADAVITISNQFASRSHHSPVHVHGGKLKSLDLRHWSWGYLLTEAILYVDHKGISDPDQVRVLFELTRYLRHDSSGVISVSQMPKEWKDVCTGVRQEARLSKSVPGLTAIVERWHELARSTALQLSMDIGRRVELRLSKAHENDPKQRVLDDLSVLTSKHRLTATLDIPDAAGKLQISVDLARRTLTVSMETKAPQDKSRASASVTWVRRQLEQCMDENILVCAKWPGSMKDTMASLGQIRLDPSKLIDNPKGKVPRAFEIRAVSELGGKFTGSRTFVEEVTRLVPRFYQVVGQHIRAWVPSPPQVRRQEEVGEDEGIPFAQKTDPEVIEVPKSQEPSPPEFQGIPFYI